MSFKFKVQKKARVPVAGAIKNEDGSPVKFNFTLLCKRLDQEEIDARLENKELPTSEFLREVVNGWEDVIAEDGTRVEFTPESFTELLLQPGLRTICFQAYLKEVGATAKN